jgi:hypothetical protein
MSAAESVSATDFQQLFAHPCIQQFNVVSRHIFNQLHHCHTAAMGMHHYRCDNTDCNHLHQQYHCCGNRHCPNCGGLKKEQWIENLTAQLFPTGYYHVVFTVPHEFNALTLGNRREMYKLLLDAASATLLQLGNDPQYLGATCGITMVLHTWGQDLSFHPHVHCIVSGGGVKDNRWVAAKRSNQKFLFPVDAMKLVYKGIFLERLRQILRKGVLQTEGIAVEQIIKKAGYKKWNVYAKSPFGSVASVIEYLGRYTHKTAITRHRIVSITQQSITFNYKDYADGNRQKQMTLSKQEFLRRFELHFLPRGFVKIRHYGFLQNHGKINRLNAVRKTMDLQPLPPIVKIPAALRMLEQYGKDISLCPKCGQGKLLLIAVVYPPVIAVKLSSKTGCPEVPGLRNKASP